MHYGDRYQITNLQKKLLTLLYNGLYFESVLNCVKIIKN